MEKGQECQTGDGGQQHATQVQGESRTRSVRHVNLANRERKSFELRSFPVSTKRKNAWKLSMTSDKTAMREGMPSFRTVTREV